MTDVIFVLHQHLLYPKLPVHAAAGAVAMLVDVGLKGAIPMTREAEAHKCRRFFI
jgi:hypothetical protein